MTHFHKIIHSAGGVVSRLIEGPYTIKVDPVNGDDAQWNDGTVTPLKSLEACFKRLPDAIHTSSLTRIPSKIVSVLLKSGTHTLPLTTPNDPLSVDFKNVAFVGELSQVGSSFIIDHYSDSDIVMYQPAGNPAWTVDEHVGRVVELTYSGFFYRYFIVANGTHDLTVAFDSTGISTSFPVGSTVYIKELATKWVGPRRVVASGSQNVLQSAFRFISFDITTSGASSLFDQQLGSLAFVTCRFVGTGSNYISNVTGKNSRQYFRSCMFQNLAPAVYVTAGEVYIYNVNAANCYRIVQAQDDASVQLEGAFFARNVFEAFRLGTGDRFGYATVLWHSMSAFWCPGSYQLFSFYGSGLLNVNGQSAVLIADQRPGVPFLIAGGVKLRLKSFTIEGAAPYPTIWIGSGLPDGAPYDGLTIADLRTVYGGHYDWGDGAEALYSQHP